MLTKPSAPALFWPAAAPSPFVLWVDERTPASVFGVVRPDCGLAIAELLGVAFEELPFGLQRFETFRAYSGNSILNRLDPSDWVLRNPWRNLSLSVIVALSRRAYNAERKRLGLPRSLDTPIIPD